MQTDEDVKDAAIGLITAALGSHTEKEHQKRIERFDEGIKLFIDTGTVYDLYRITTLVIDIAAYLVEFSAVATDRQPDEIMGFLAKEVKETTITSIDGNDTQLGLDETFRDFEED